MIRMIIGGISFTIPFLGTISSLLGGVFVPMAVFVVSCIPGLLIYMWGYNSRKKAKSEVK